MVLLRKQAKYAEFDQGMAALHAHRAKINPNEAVTGEIDWFGFTKSAQPPLSAKRV